MNAQWTPSARSRGERKVAFSSLLVLMLVSFSLPCGGQHSVVLDERSDQVDARWKLLAEDEVTGERAYVADLRVWESFGDKPKATEGWLMATHKTPQQQSNGAGSFRAVQAKVEIDCETNRMRTSHRIWFADSSGRGKNISSAIQPAQTAEAPPGSKARRLVDKLCSYEALKQLGWK